jgi:hypothetical protein
MHVRSCASAPVDCRRPASDLARLWHDVIPTRGLSPAPTQLIEVRVEPRHHLAAFPSVVLADLVDRRPGPLARVPVQRCFLDLKQRADVLGRQNLVARRKGSAPLSVAGTTRSSPPTAPSTSSSPPANSSCRRIDPRRSPSTWRSRTSGGTGGFRRETAAFHAAAARSTSTTCPSRWGRADRSRT